MNPLDRKRFFAAGASRGMTLQPGTDAPTVRAPNQDGEEVTLEFAEPTVLDSNH